MNKSALVLLLLFPIALLAQTDEAASQAQEVIHAFDAASQTMVLSDALKNYYGLDGSLHLSALYTIEPLATLPDRVEILDAPANLAPNMMIRARFMDGKKPVGNIAGPFKAKLFKQALVTNRMIRRGDAISQKDLVQQQVDVLGERVEVVPFDAKLKDFEAANSIGAGKVLTWSALRSKPLVYKGDIVEVVAAAGALKITSKAYALSDAGLNEIVTLRNTSSNQKFQAKVINENLAEISF